MRAIPPLAAPLLCVLTGCAGEPSSFLEIDFEPVGTGAMQTAELSANAEVDIRFTPAGGMVELTVDCLRGAEPPTDQVGFRFSVASSAFGLEETMPGRAGYLRIRDELPAAPTLVRLVGSGGPATCDIRVAPVASACGRREIFRSVQTSSTHVDVAMEPRAGWEPFPVSGEHYPTWAAWDTFYVRPVRTGYLLHNLEHGGVVFSYRCASPSESAECTTSANSLTAGKARFAKSRSYLTPDPAQPERYAARAWRWGYLSTCYDEDDLLDFATRRFRKGREDVDANPGTAFDPTL